MKQIATLLLSAAGHAFREFWGTCFCRKFREVPINLCFAKLLFTSYTCIVFSGKSRWLRNLSSCFFSWWLALNENPTLCMDVFGFCLFLFGRVHKNATETAKYVQQSSFKKMSGVQFVPAVKDYFKNSLKERSQLC